MTLEFFSEKSKYKFISIRDSDYVNNFVFSKHTQQLRLGWNGVGEGSGCSPGGCTLPEGRQSLSAWSIKDSFQSSPPCFFLVKYRKFEVETSFSIILRRIKYFSYWLNYILVHLDGNHRSIYQDKEACLLSFTPAFHSLPPIPCCLSHQT